MITKDNLQTAIQGASGGKQVVLYDQFRKPSIMTKIPKFNIEDIDPLLGSGVHPAFLVNGVTKNEIYIGTYQSVLDGGVAYSLPNQSPAVSINFDNAKKACMDKGAGWHMMTNWEWSAIVLWCLKNGFQPRGNSVSGKSDAAAWESGTPAPDNAVKTLSGSGPASWRHDNTYQGIADLVGNVWEWQDGFKIVNGEILMPNDNDFNLLEANWPNQTPGVVVFGVQNTGAAGWRTQTTAFGSLAASTIQKLAQAALIPNLSAGNTPLALYNTLQGGFWITKTGEMLPLRGGYWDGGASDGLGALYLSSARSNVSTIFGFRLSCIL